VRPYPLTTVAASGVTDGNAFGAGFAYRGAISGCISLTAVFATPAEHRAMTFALGEVSMRRAAHLISCDINGK